MSKLKKLLAFVFLFPVVTMAAETINQPVKSYRYDAARDITYVIGPNSWGSAGCPNAIFVMISPSLPGRKQIFAAIVSAQAAGKTVKFYGECSADPYYFDATYIFVE